MSTQKRERLVAALSSRESLRQAFLLMEVLGPPVALREQELSGASRRF